MSRVRPENRCFEVVPTRGDGDYLYVIQLDDGAVKVGRTYHPRQRLREHRKNFAAKGRRLLRFAVHVTPEPRCCTLHEREMCARLSKLGELVPGTLEMFRGVAFGAAVTLLRQIAPRQFAEAA